MFHHKSGVHFTICIVLGFWEEQKYWNDPCSQAPRNNVLNVCDKVIFLKVKDTDRYKNKSPYTLLFYSFVLFLMSFLKTERREIEFLQRNEKVKGDGKEKNQFSKEAAIISSKPLVVVVLWSKNKRKSSQNFKRYKDLTGPSYWCSSWAKFLWPSGSAFNFL